jgi:hypothetical protein
MVRGLAHAQVPLVIHIELSAKILLQVNLQLLRSALIGWGVQVIAQT